MRRQVHKTVFLLCLVCLLLTTRTVLGQPPTAYEEAPQRDTLSYSPPQERFFAATITTSNALLFGDGTNGIDLLYGDSLNSLHVAYRAQYHNLGHINNSRQIDYPEQRAIVYDGQKRFVGATHDISAAYQRQQGQHLINANVYGSLAPQHERGSRRAQITADDHSDYSGVGEYCLAARANTIAVDLYYRYRIAASQQLAINVVNTFGATYSDCSQTMTATAQSSNSDYDYAIHAHTDNNAYALLATVQYTTPLAGGLFDIASRYEYKQLRQRYDNTVSLLHAHKERLAAGQQWRWGEAFALHPSVGLDILRQQSATTAYTSVLPYLHVDGAWHGSGSSRGLSLQLSASMESVSPTLSDLSASTTFLDPWLMAVGTPTLASSWKVSGMLRLAYSAPDDRFVAALVVSPSYDKHHIATAVSVDDGMTILSPQDIGGDFECRNYLYLSFSPLRWLTIAPYIENDISRFSTPVRDIRESYWRAGGTVRAALHSLLLTAEVQSPMRRYDSNLIAHSGWRAAASIQYALPCHWTIGAEYNYAGHSNYIYADTPRIMYFDNNDWTALHHTVRLNVVYTFAVGHQRRHSEKVPHEVSRDMGLGKFNAPKLP